MSWVLMWNGGRGRFGMIDDFMRGRRSCVEVLCACETTTMSCRHALDVHL